MLFNLQRNENSNEENNDGTARDNPKVKKKKRSSQITDDNTLNKK
jgi:hypothetical protein